MITEVKRVQCTVCKTWWMSTYVNDQGVCMLCEDDA